MKRILVLCMCVIVFLCCLSTQTFAYKAYECGDNVYWSMDSNGVLTISGNGKMDDYERELDAPWNTRLITKVIIEEGVETIGNYAFSNCENLTYAEIQEGVTKIGMNAFKSCQNLASVSLPQSLTSIGSGCFYGCSALSQIDIPKSVKYLGEGYENNSYAVFEYCKALKSVNIPENSDLVLIEQGAFYESAIKSIYIPDKVSEIGFAAFDTLINEINVSENNTVYTSIDGVLFSKDLKTLISYPCMKSVAEYTIPESTTRIESRAFKNVGVAFYDFDTKKCTNTMKLYVPDTIVEMEKDAIATEMKLDIYYGGEKEQWMEFVNNSGVSVTKATVVHYSDQKSSKDSKKVPIGIIIGGSGVTVCAVSIAAFAIKKRYLKKK